MATISGSDSASISSWNQLRNEDLLENPTVVSTDPAQWDHVSEGPWSRRRKHQSVVWGSNLLLLGGFDGEAAFDLNDVWSFDGKEWLMVTDHAGWSGRDGHCAVVFKGSIFVMGGTDDPYNCKCDVWRSDNGGSTWLQICPYAPWPERWQHAACVFDGRIYVIGGWGDRYLSDVWASSDGINWTQECACAPWKPRMFLSAVVFNDAIYVIGGHDGRMQLRDVWASSDGGKSWTQVCQAAQWEGRQGHACVSLDGHVYLMGGFGGATRFNDLWRSSDCAHWTLVARQCNWSPRQGHACLAFRGSIYIIGGFDASGYCNNVYRLRVSEEDGTVLPNNDQDLVGDEKTHLASMSTQLPLMRRGTSRQITVSITCVMDSIDLLRSKRHDREKMVQGLVSVVGLVMGCVNITAEGLEEVNSGLDNWPDIQSNSEDVEPLNVVSLRSVGGTGTGTGTGSGGSHGPITPGKKEKPATVSPRINEKSGAALQGLGQKERGEDGGKEGEKKLPQGGAIVRSTSVGPEGITSPLAKIGHPFRMALAATGVPVSGQHGIKNDEDLLMQFWQVLPQKSSRSTSEDMKSVPASASDEERQSSAALRESMEQDRATLHVIQRNIRRLAEDNENHGAEIEGLIVGRTVLALRSVLLAEQLRQHVRAVREMQDSRHRVLSRTLSQLEDLLLLVAGKKGPPGPVPLTGGEETETLKDPETEESYERCSWVEWEDVMKRCSVVMKAIDCVPTENAISALKDDLAKLSAVTLRACTWMDIGAFDTPAVTAPKFFGSEGLLLLLKDGSSTGRKTMLDLRSPSQEEGGAVGSTSGASDSLSSESVCSVLSAEYEAVLARLDKRRMDVKTTVDNEVTAINQVEPELHTVMVMIITKGCGLTRNLISQNRLDTMEITAMETEMIDWLEKVKILSDREALKAKCERYLSENATMEEHLLNLENERIDIRSSLEKASLLGSRRHLHDGVDIEEIKESLRVAEKNVKNARKDMRAWFREVKKFSVEMVPELFQVLPDLRSTGSVMGDGGFAESAKLPRRRMEEYENIEPLTNPVWQQLKTPLKGDAASMSTSTSSGADRPGTSPATSTTLAARMRKDSVDDYRGSGVPGRHVLLKATYDGEEVVLKGFIMNEKDQRKGLERELAILGRLRNDSVICPSALVEDSGTNEKSFLQQLAVFIEYPYYKGGNLSIWLKTGERKPWELQGIARQLLYGLLFLHDHGVIHRDVKPSNVLMHEDGRVVLSDFELSREVKKNEDAEVTSTYRSGTRGFMAPEVEAGAEAVLASDMYSFGVLLLYMHYPTLVTALIPGTPNLPASCEGELSDLIIRLLSLSQGARPSAAAALMHPYFRSTFVERLLQEGEVVEQDRKLEAVRDLLHRVRSENRTNLEKLTVGRETIVATMLQYFEQMPLEKMIFMFKISFVGEPGVDEGGLLTEMLTIFFNDVFSGVGGLFESASAAGDVLKGPDGSASTDHATTVRIASDVVLPCGADTSPERMRKLRAFGRAMVKALYEGRRIGNRLCPSVFKFLTGTSPSMRDLQMFDPQTARSLQWTLATIGVEEFGIHFESVGEPEGGVVNDSNKSKFVRSKIEQILVKNRHPHLLAIKAGFSEALRSLSEEAAPFLSLLSHTDWRVMLCGDTAISGPQVNAALKYTGFPKRSLVPQWLKEIIISFSEDHLREFLVFVTGCPSLASTSSFGKVEINVRHQARSGALPVAHTCFFHLDIPDYKEKEVLQSKLMYAIQHATSFEIV